jgi:hypothetical protein
MLSNLDDQLKKQLALKKEKKKACFKVQPRLSELMCNLPKYQTIGWFELMI